MTPHQVKEGYLSLPPKAQREFVLWAVQREFSDTSVEGLETQQIASVQAALIHGNQAGSVSTAASPGLSGTVKAVIALVVVLIVAGGGGYLFQQSSTSRQQASAAEAEAAARQAAAEFEAREAARPSSPTNLEYLTQRLGKEVTLRGVPVKSEVGYLYFHEDPAKGARVKLISGGVVVYQSTELEQWVQDGQELEIRGMLVRNEEDDVLEIPVDRQIQVKLVGK